MGNCFASCFGGTRERESPTPRSSSPASKQNVYGTNTGTVKSTNTGTVKSTGGGGSKSSPPTGKHAQSRHWQATGIVGCRDQQLKELPSSVLDVGEAAKVLDLTNNKIRSLNPEVSRLYNLQRLVIVNNLLQALPHTITSLSNLKILILDLNQIEELPREIGMLTKLEKLSAHGNRLVALPDSMSLLKALTTLNVSGNLLTGLPESLSGCSALEEIDASNNQLDTVPSCLAPLIRLKTLNLDYNRVTSISPAVLNDCVALQTLSLHNNPIIPSAVEGTDGYEAFETRRRLKYNKAIHAGVMLNNGGLDEGVDREVRPKGR